MTGYEKIVSNGSHELNAASYLESGIPVLFLNFNMLCFRCSVFIFLECILRRSFTDYQNILVYGFNNSKPFSVKHFRLHRLPHYTFKVLPC